MTNKAAIRLWVDELRSGKHLQDKETLRTDKGFCCLGVACSASGLGEWQVDTKGSYFYHISGSPSDLCNRSYSVLPEKVATWLGLEDLSPAISVKGKSILLAQLNDSEVSFARIASLIEANYLNEKEEGDSNE